MKRAEFQADVEAIWATANRHRAHALASKNPLGAMRAQLAMMAAEGLLEEKFDWVEAVFQVDQIAADIEREEGG